MYDETVEQEALEMLHEYELAKQNAERKLILARQEVDEKDQAISHVKFFIENYRRKYGLTAQTDAPSPVLEAEYAHLGPTELVEYWADKNDGKVVVKELTRAGVEAGLFKSYRLGSSMIYAVAKRKGFDKTGPGVFQRPEPKQDRSHGFLILDLDDEQHYVESN